jgi:hypothetical protein
VRAAGADGFDAAWVNSLPVFADGVVDVTTTATAPVRLHTSRTQLSAVFTPPTRGAVQLQLALFGALLTQAEGTEVHYV